MKKLISIFWMTVICFLILIGCGEENQSLTPTATETRLLPTLTQTSTATLIPTLTPTFTPTHTPTLTPTITITPTIILTPGIGSVRTNSVDGAEISYVPAGEFVMGAEIQEDWDFCDQFKFPGCEDAWFETGNPVLKVYLDEFWMYQTEVTNAQFAGFLNEVGNQIEDGRNWLNAWSEYVQIHQVSGSWRVDNGYDDIPVVEVTWYGAAAYCDWVGARLPTEAEWEKAARGGLERKVYPWGNVLGDNLANFCDMNCKGTFANLYFDDEYSSIAPIRSYSPNGYGLFDMAGNVSEWVADWYDRYYYEYSPYLNPTGPENGFSRVVRGGSAGSIQEYLQVATRYHEVPSISRLSIGFRCVFSGSP